MNNSISPLSAKLEKSSSSGLSWTRFIIQIIKDLRLYLYCMASLSLFRLILILVFISRKDPASGGGDILSAMANGMRFDSRVSMFVIIPTVLLSVICGFFPINKIIDRVRFFIATGFTLLTLLLGGTTIFYFKEYNDQFNQWVFGLVYDDLGAIIKTIWSQVPVFPLFAVLVALLAGLIFILKKRLNRQPGWAVNLLEWPVGAKVLVTIFMILLMSAAGRGSIGRRPVQIKDVGITRDAFLNKTVLNPYEAIRYLLGEHKKLQSARGINTFLAGGDIRSALKSYCDDPRNLDNIDGYLLQRAKGGHNPQPRHIFLLVMEGYDSWPMLDKYASLQTCEQLKAIAGKGVWIKRFLPASVGTTPALSTIITGLPEAGVMTNYQPSSRRPYPTAIAPIMKKLGYKTRFFYGGYLTWQRIGDFCKDQGFDEVYGAPSMGDWAHANEWGVDDKALFDFVEKTISDDQPSFSLIMTTSYHPPYDIDVFRLGYPHKTIPPDLAGIYDGGIEMKVFGHLWYADKCIGEFIERMGKKLICPVFAMTGDHWSRKFLNSRPTLYERSSVPLILYGPAVLKDMKPRKDAIGSHIDIVATLIELAAPEGFTYHCIGRDLMGDAPPKLAFGAHSVIMGPGFIMEMKNPNRAEPIPGNRFSPPDIDLVNRRANQYFAISWWRIMRGASLRVQTIKSDNTQTATD